MTTSIPLDAVHTPRTALSPIARRLNPIGRFSLGLVFFVCGLNGFLNFLPQPAEAMPEGALTLIGAFMKAGYFLPVLAGTQTLAGALLLLNRFVPLALALLAPVIVHILLFNVFLAPAGLGLALVVFSLELYLAWSYREVYRPMLLARVQTGRDR
jgi:hypothetical protein